MCKDVRAANGGELWASMKEPHIDIDYIAATFLLTGTRIL